MSRLRVEKTPLRVRLYLADGTRAEGELFVAPMSPAGAGPQPVWQLLEEAGPVVPFRDAQGRFCLVGTRQVAAVETLEAASDPLPPPPWVRAVPVEVRLAGGHELVGDLLLEVEGRPVDALRTPGEWVFVRRLSGGAWVRKALLVVLRLER
ncbi:MAG: hypothetical protein GXP50_04115 [Deltaproteobacteria bacterium]|nr:hypothetical protein [Deltaproteobacteria bacterium]